MGKRPVICLGVPGEPCSILTTNKGGRCDDHTKRQAMVTRDPVLNTREWRRLAEASVAAYRQQHGNVCPGWGVPPHLATRDNPLTADHRIPRARGGAPLDPRNVTILCRSCNGRKAASETPAPEVATA